MTTSTTVPDPCLPDCSGRLPCKGLQVSSGRIHLAGTSQLFMTGGVTVEAWVRLDVASAGVRLLFGKHACGSPNGFVLGFLNDAPWAHAGGNSVGGDRPLLIGHWYHVAMVSTGAELRVFVDGERVAVGNVANLTTDAQWTLGGCSNENTDVVPLGATIDELRVSSSARYSASFTPPLFFVPDAATMALYHFSDAANSVLSDASGSGFHLALPSGMSLVGDSTCSLRAPCHSIDVTAGSGVTTTGSQNEHLASGVTVEAWLHPSAAAHPQYSVVAGKHGCGEASGFALFLYEGRPNFYIGGQSVLAAQALASDRWQHVAGQWEAGEFVSVFLDGKLVDWHPGGPPVENGWPLSVGVCANGPQSGVGYFPGLIDEVRISYVARYASPFMPPRRLADDDKTRALWRLDEGSGTRAGEVASGYDGTLTTGVVWSTRCAQSL